jgi:hypothetical protein
MSPPSGLKLWWIKLVYRATFSCAHVTRLLSQSQDRPLTLAERLKLRLHFLICVWCDRYARHLAFLRRAAPQCTEHLQEVPGGGLSEEARRRLKERLRHPPAA